jgi:PadR family transcriptional regulator AphA
MTIEFTILGLLNQQPMTGYELKKIISRSPTFYWSGNSNQIYTHLVELQRQGFLSLEVVYQENKPPRKIYTITEYGRNRLVEWLRNAPQLPERKHPFLIQLAWANLLSDEELDRLLEAYEAEILIQLKMAKQQGISAEPVAPATERQSLIWEQITRSWVGYYKSELKWTQEFRQKFIRKEETP